VSPGAQSNGYTVQGFGAASGAAATCPSRVPPGKTCAEAERPRNPGSCTAPLEKLRPITTIDPSHTCTRPLSVKYLYTSA